VDWRKPDQPRTLNLRASRRQPSDFEGSRLSRTGGKLGLWYIDGGLYRQPPREDKVHRGTLLATLLCGCIVLAIPIWILTQPLLVGTYSIVMHNSATGQNVVCRASLAPGFRAANAVSVCELSCEDRGFKLVNGPAPMDIEYADDDQFHRDQARWQSLIPTACQFDRP
jgi:hypothetical protein